MSIDSALRFPFAMPLHTSYHADSDADDEYERSVVMSPHLITESDSSSVKSERHSPEHTPTTAAYSANERRPPNRIITQWTAHDTADFVSSLGLQYRDILIGECPHPH